MNIPKIKKQKSILYIVGLFLALLFLSLRPASAAFPKTFLFPNEFFKPQKALFSATYENLFGVAAIWAQIPGSKCQYTQTEGGTLAHANITIPKDGNYQAWTDIYNHSDIDIGPLGETFTITLTFNPTGAVGGDKPIPKTVPALLIKQRVYFDLGYVLKGQRTFTLTFEGAPVDMNNSNKQIAICEFGISDSGKVSDVIGVKVFANPFHLSAENWYKGGMCRGMNATNIDNVCFSDSDCRGFVCNTTTSRCNNPDTTVCARSSDCQNTCNFNIANRGATSPVTVDGFTGIKSGRTTYVNATNLEGGALYTNIYLLSYNENASEETIAIFNDLLKNWKFMENVPDLSLKDKLRRDTTRFADIRSIQILLRNYQRQNGYYPLWDNVRKTLSGGTYVPGVSLSTWPSWKNTLAKELKVTLPIDPDNTLRICPNPGCGRDPAAILCNADSKTCWDEKSLKFSCPTDSPNSYFYVYQILNASSYKLGVNLEYRENGGNWLGELNGTGYLDSATSRIGFPVCNLNNPATDLDNDGVADTIDNCPPSKCTTPLMCANPVSVCQSDMSTPCTKATELIDCSGVGNACVQPDTDRDVLGNLCDVCPNSSGNDQDHDGVCENSSDNVSNLPDNCPTTFNPDQKNSDGIGSGDACDTTCQKDSDNDTICDENDNCPTAFNPGQENYDVLQDPASGQIWPNGREFGDACDPNTDHDSDGFATGFCGAYSGANFRVCNADVGCDGFALGINPTRCQKLPASTSSKLDNCNSGNQTFNPGQEDYDKDLVGYVCDDCIDTDKDGNTNTIMNEGFESGLGLWTLTENLKASVTSDRSRVGVHTNYAHLDDDGWIARTADDKAYRGVQAVWIQSRLDVPKWFVYKTFLSGPVYMPDNFSTNNAARYKIKAQVKSDRGNPITMIVRRACHNNAGAIGAQPVPYKANCKGNGGAGDIYATDSTANASWDLLEANFFIDYSRSQDEVAIIFEMNNTDDFYIDDVQLYWRLSETFGAGGADSCAGSLPDNCNNFSNSLQCAGGEKNGAVCASDADCLGADGASTADDGACILPDRDADNVGDACDECTDSDADGFGDPGYVIKGCAGSYNASDNCPITPNTDQKDYDNDAKLCNFTIAMPYKTKSTFASCTGGENNFDPKLCDFCGGDVCDLDADGDRCYNWEQIKNNLANAQRNPAGAAGVVGALINREEEYLLTGFHYENTWLKASSDMDRDGLPDDCDAQMCGDAQVSAGTPPACSDPAIGLQQCEECDRNNFGISSVCDDPNPIPGVNPGSTLRDIYPFNTANTNVRFIAHFDGDLIALGRGMNYQPAASAGISYFDFGANNIPILNKSAIIDQGSTLRYPENSYNKNEGTINIWVRPGEDVPNIEIKNPVTGATVQTFAVNWVDPNSWHMITATYGLWFTPPQPDPPAPPVPPIYQYTFYLDGILQTGNVYLPPLSGEIDMKFWLWFIGLQVDTPGNPMAVGVDEFVIFSNRITSDAIVKAIYDAAMQRCDQSLSHEITKFMSDNLCASCNNSQCQINTLRTCIPLTGISLDSSIVFSNTEIGKPENITKYLWVKEFPYGSGLPVNVFQVNALLSNIGTVASIITSTNTEGQNIGVDNLNNRMWTVAREPGNPGGWVQDFDYLGILKKQCFAGGWGGNAGARVIALDNFGNSWNYFTGTGGQEGIRFEYSDVNDPNCTVPVPAEYAFNANNGVRLIYPIAGGNIDLPLPNGMIVDADNNLWITQGSLNYTLRLDLDVLYDDTGHIAPGWFPLQIAPDHKTCTLNNEADACYVFDTPNPGDIAIDANGNAWVVRTTAFVPTPAPGTWGVYRISNGATDFTNGVRNFILPNVFNPLHIAVDIDNMLWVSRQLQGNAANTPSNTIFQVNTETGEETGVFADPNADIPGTYGIAADSSGGLWAKNDRNNLQRWDIHSTGSDGKTLTSYNVEGTSVISAGLSPRILRAIAGTPSYDVPIVFQAVNSSSSKWSNHWGKILFDVDPERLRGDIQAQVTLSDSQNDINGAIPDASWMDIDEFNKRISTLPAITMIQYLADKTSPGEITGKFLKLRFRAPSGVNVNISNIRITCRDAAGVNICQ